MDWGGVVDLSSIAPWRLAILVFHIWTRQRPRRITFLSLINILFMTFLLLQPYFIFKFLNCLFFFLNYQCMPLLLLQKLSRTSVRLRFVPHLQGSTPTCVASRKCDLGIWPVKSRTCKCDSRVAPLRCVSFITRPLHKLGQSHFTVYPASFILRNRFYSHHSPF